MRGALLVGLGGFLGSLSRWGLGLYLAHKLGKNFPWATFTINVTGCFVIALFLTVGAIRSSEDIRLLIPVGFVGAYTTFSTYAWETLRLTEEGAWGRAILYVVGSNVVGFLAVFLGSILGKRI
jgi:CrcB protein